MVCESKCPVPKSEDTSKMATESGIQHNDIYVQEAELKGDIVSEVFKFFLFIEEVKNEANKGDLAMLQEACLYFMEEFVKVFFGFCGIF